MSTITVKFVNEKDGKYWGLKDASDKWYSFEHAKLSFAKGKTYEVETTSKTLDDGRTFFTITAAKEKSGGGGNDVASWDRWWMPFVSNTVAHAIQAAQITDPLQIKTWAAAAKQAALEIERGPVKSGDDDDSQVPF